MMDRRRVKRELISRLPAQLAEDKWLRDHMSNRKRREKTLRGMVDLSMEFGLPDLPPPPASEEPAT